MGCELGLPFPHTLDDGHPPLPHLCPQPDEASQSGCLIPFPLTSTLMQGSVTACFPQGAHHTKHFRVVQTPCRFCGDGRWCTRRSGSSLCPLASHILSLLGLPTLPLTLGPCTWHCLVPVTPYSSFLVPAIHAHLEHIILASSSLSVSHDKSCLSQIPHFSSWI